MTQADLAAYWSDRPWSSPSWTVTLQMAGSKRNTVRHIARHVRAKDEAAAKQIAIATERNVFGHRGWMRAVSVAYMTPVGG